MGKLGFPFAWSPRGPTSTDSCLLALERRKPRCGTSERAGRGGGCQGLGLGDLNLEVNSGSNLHAGSELHAKLALFRQWTRSPGDLHWSCLVPTQSGRHMTSGRRHFQKPPVVAQRRGERRVLWAPSAWSRPKHRFPAPNTRGAAAIIADIIISQRRRLSLAGLSPPTIWSVAGQPFPGGCPSALPPSRAKADPPSRMMMSIRRHSGAVTRDRQTLVGHDGAVAGGEELRHSPIASPQYFSLVGFSLA